MGREFDIAVVIMAQMTQQVLGTLRLQRQKAHELSFSKSTKKRAGGGGSWKPEAERRHEGPEVRA